MTDKIDWYSIEGETRRYGSGVVECAYAVGRNQVVYVVTHESVKDIAMQHLPTQRKPLTDEQINAITKQYALSLAFPYDGPTTPKLFARAIEAAHGITKE